MPYCYILYSERIDSFYVGATTEAVETRLLRHNENYYNDKWTQRGTPWSIFLVIQTNSMDLAAKIEQHIKRMKSRKYIENLKLYPEIIDKLKQKYQ